MAVTFVGADLSNSGNVTAITGLNWPGHAAGDLALFGGGMLNTATQTLDALITQLREDVDQNLKGVLGVRLPGAMTGSESGAIDMTVLAGDTNRMVAGIAVFRGCSGIGTPTYLAEGGTAVSTHSSPAVTLASANDGILLIYIERQSTSASTITPPSGYIDAGQFGTGGSGGTVMCLAYKVAGNSSGSNSPGTWSSTNTASNCEVYAIPLTAAATATTLSPGGIASAESWGTPGETSNLPLSPTGITSGEAWGSVALALSLLVSPGGIPSGEQFGTPGAAPVLTVSPAAIASSEAWGTPSASSTLTVSPVGIASGEAFGTPSVALGNLTASPGGIVSGEAFGAPVVTVAGFSTPTGIPSGEAFGVPVIALSLTISPSGIPSAGAFGTPGAGLSLTVGPVGIATAGAWGLPALFSTLQVQPDGIASGEAWGLPAVSTVLAVGPAGILSGESWGLPTATVAVPAVQRDLTLSGVIEIGRFAGVIEVGRWSGTLEQGRWKGAVPWPDQ